jgi:hypothetical protein
MKRLTMLVAAAAALFLDSAHAAGNDAIERARRAVEHTIALDYALAHRELEGADPDSPAVAYAAGHLALHEGDCDKATSLLSLPGVDKGEKGEALADVARGCARVTAATVVERDEAAAIEVRFQDELDKPLLPYIVETAVKAREALTKDLQVDWPRPTRITVVRDLLSLSAMTGLPYEAAQTTGTVAVAKWGRVTLLSPRASRHGYTWRDTLAHELTHLAVTRASADRAPLWLQEGVAKREEVRWRAPGPFDGRPAPEAIVKRGIELKLDLPLDKLGPSIAMLPSADAALVAFAEVTSFVQYYVATSGPEALPKLLQELKARRPIDESLVNATGGDLKAWDQKWRSYLVGLKTDKLPSLYALGQTPPNLKDVRERTRLAELLFGRDHVPEALKELDAIDTKDKLTDPSLRALRARVLDASGKTKDAEALVQDPKDVLSSVGAWWALRGRFARTRGDETLAAESFWEALAADPLDEEVACEAMEASAAPKDAARRLLCEAARARKEPKVGRE